MSVLQINTSGFYIHNIKRLGQCISLFKSESELRLVLCYSDGTISVSSLILANIALLQVILRPTSTMDDYTVLLQTPRDTSKAPVCLYLSTTIFLRALTEAAKFDATYCVLYPSVDEDALIISSFDAQNREMSTLSIHHIDPDTDVLSTLPPIERAVSGIQITRVARVLAEYFSTNADTEIMTAMETGCKRLVWTTKDTLLTSRSNLYCKDTDVVQTQLTQSFLKGIMTFIKQTLLFMNHLECTLTMGIDKPLHLYHACTNESGLSIDLVSGYMVDID
jgi:hypothetical protein